MGPVMYGPDGEGVVEGYATDIITDLSLEWLQVRNRDLPFCIMVHHKAPHRPWVPHERHRDLYPAGSIPVPLTMWDDHSGRASVVQEVRMTIADDLTDADIKETVPAELLGAENSRKRAAWKYQRYMRDYLQSVQAVDDGVGRLLDGLDVEGLAENTMVVYTSDQGFFLGDHGWFDKRLMYEQSLGMPLVIRWPAEITAGTRCQEMIINVDFAATFLDMCGLDPDVALPHQQGRSFRVLLRGADVPDWPSVVYYRYWEHDDPEHHAPAHYGVGSEDFKYIVYYNDGLGTPGRPSGSCRPSTNWSTSAGIPPNCTTSSMTRTTPP